MIKKGEGWAGTEATWVFKSQFYPNGSQGRSLKAKKLFHLCNTSIEKIRTFPPPLYIIDIIFKMNMSYSVDKKQYKFIVKKKKSNTTEIID